MGQNFLILKPPIRIDYFGNPRSSLLLQQLGEA